MNIYVGNLPNSVNEGDLREVFQAFGEVSTAAVIKDKFSGESRGFGFVEMPNKDEAEKAISLTNGKDLKGRTAKVNEAKPPRTQGPAAVSAATGGTKTPGKPGVPTTAPRGERPIPAAPLFFALRLTSCSRPGGSGTQPGAGSTLMGALRSTSATPISPFQTR